MAEARVYQSQCRAAQVLQCIGQARNHTRFRQSDISTYLVVADDDAKEGYRGWEALMRDGRQFNLYIDAGCVAFADAIEDRPDRRSA